MHTHNASIGFWGIAGSRVDEIKNSKREIISKLPQLLFALDTEFSILVKHPTVPVCLSLRGSPPRPPRRPTPSAGSPSSNNYNIQGCIKFLIPRPLGGLSI